jgi:hypothetical protein
LSRSRRTKENPKEIKTLLPAFETSTTKKDSFHSNFRDGSAHAIGHGRLEHVSRSQKQEKTRRIKGFFRPTPICLLKKNSTASNRLRSSFIAKELAPVVADLPDVTGFIAGEIDQLVAAVGRIDSISRQRCRLEFEERFTAKVMVDKYEAVYDHVLNPIKMRNELLLWSG